MNETILFETVANPKIPRALFIFLLIMCIPFILTAVFGRIWFCLVFAIAPMIAYVSYKNNKGIKITITDQRIIASGGRFGSETTVPLSSIIKVTYSFYAVEILHTSGVIVLLYLYQPREVHRIIEKLISAQ